jgi:hypothetical protein
MKKYIPFLISFFALIIYSLTAFQTLTFTDNGELAAVAVSLGISHPTGYPIFTILANLWSNLPLGIDIIYKLNLFSSFLIATSLFFLYKTIDLIQDQFKPKELTKIILSSSITLIFAFGNLIWQQAGTFEVYPLHILFLTLIVYNSLKLIFDYSEKTLLILFFLFGLSFTNHLTTILLTPSLLFLLIFDNNFKIRKLSQKTYLTGFGLFFLALSIYLYLPIRSSMDPLFNWGDVSRGFDKFLYHVQGKQYQVWMFSGSEAMKENLAKIPDMLWNQFQFLLFPILLGLYYSFKKAKYVFVFLLLSAITTILYSINYTIHDIDPYFSLLILSLTIFSVYGMIWLIKGNAYLKYVPILIFISILLSNFGDNNNSENNSVETYTNNMVDNLEPNAIILSAQWDFWASAFWFKQKIQNYRSDVILIEKELLRRTWYPAQLLKWYPALNSSKPELDRYMTQLELFEAEKPYNQMEIQTSFISLLKSFIDKNINERPIYLTLDILQTEPELTKSYILKPEGLAFRVYKEEPTSHISKLENLNLESLLNKKEEHLNHLDEGMRQFIATTYINLGRLHITQNQFDSAKVAAQKALLFDNTNQMAQQMYEQLK